MGHDSAAALLGDSGIVAAMEESKLARTRAIEGIPREAIRYCLERAGNRLARRGACGDCQPSVAGVAAASFVSRKLGAACAGFQRVLCE